MHWARPVDLTPSEALIDVADGSLLVARRLLQLGIDDPERARAFIDPGCYTPTTPFALPDMERAVERLQQAIDRRDRLLVWGDFDMDGQSATALLYSALKTAGAHVQYHVPLRDGEGHGIAEHTLQAWLKRGIDCILTCDTGTEAHEAVAMASHAGVDVIVTDHHTLGDTLPAAAAVVNPMRLPEGHPLRDLPGVGVAYKLIEALQGRDRPDLLDLAALGIVGDVAVLRADTRYLLQRGLEALRLTERTGLKALLEIAEIDPASLNESHIGFRIAPRLNAQGRLGDAAVSVELLTTHDQARAAELANQLEGMNARRKYETSAIEAAALRQLERDPALLEYAVIVLAHREWTGGIVGIVANRLAERFQRPVILLAERDGVLTGSARSVIGVNITEALRQNSRFLLRVGGHAMAAGMSLKAADLFAFRKALSTTVRAMRGADPREQQIVPDMLLSLPEMNMALADEIERLAPFGNGNAPPLFLVENVHVAIQRKLGRDTAHLEVQLEDANGHRATARWWNAPLESLPGGLIDVACTLRKNDYKGRIETIAEITAIREVDPVVVAPEDTTEWIDLRSRPLQPGILEKLREAEPDASIWAEGDAVLGGLRRDQLVPADTLIVYTAPPSDDVWQAAFERVRPKRVMVLAEVPQPPEVNVLVETTARMLKGAISRRNGEIGLSTLAGALAQRESTVRLALRWLEYRGLFAIQISDDGIIHVSVAPASGPDADTQAVERSLRAAIDETTAYRRYFVREKRLRSPLPSHA
jgi:single-stranded-DNA-specific exonuclease